MRRWERALIGTLCGACGEQIEKGDIVRRIVLPEVTRPLTRCVSCADEFPPDLPPLAPPTASPIVLDDRPMARIPPRDWKARVFGD